MTVTPTVSGAVALLLYGARAGQEIDDSLVEAILELRELVGADIRELVDRWMAEGGPDGEQIYCLDHLLQGRCAADPQFQAAAEAIVGVGQVAKNAITALADHCRRGGFRGAYVWCQTALIVPAVVSQAVVSQAVVSQAVVGQAVVGQAST